MGSKKSESSEKTGLEKSKSTSTRVKRDEMNPLIPLEDQLYFYGLLEREDLNYILKKNGDFIVRQSQNPKNLSRIVLSVMCEEKILHFPIEFNEEAECTLGDAFYKTVPLLIEDYLKTKKVLSEKSGAVLRRPLRRKKWQLKHEDIKLMKRLGKGQFGEVWEGTLRNEYGEEENVAIKKCLQNIPEEEKAKFLNEGRLMRYLEKHANVIKFIGIAAQKSPLMLVMEIASEGSLDKYLIENSTSTEKKVKFCLDIAKGMHFLSENGIIHRDLAARNCLLDECMTVKISDFGMSQESILYKMAAGRQKIPIKWTAPEALKHGLYTTKSDVWSFGVVIWEIFSECKTQPYEGMRAEDIVNNIEDGYRMSPPPNMSDKIAVIMGFCWCLDPKKRSNFSDLVRYLSKIYEKL